MRAHPEPIGQYSPSLRSPVPFTPTTPTVLFVVNESDRTFYAGDQFTRLFAHTAADAARLLASHTPRVIVVDWDDATLLAPDTCAALATMPGLAFLGTTGDVSAVPAMLRSGCHGVLLKPFVPNLVAARLGRMLRETAYLGNRSRIPPGLQIGTNRVWPNTACPQCGTHGATSFDFSSYRRMWYACLACDSTWLGKRQE